MEIWKNIKSLENYQVSNIGNIRNIQKVIIDPILNGNYLSVLINNKLYYIHQLVAIEFKGHIPCGYKIIVNHIDFNKLNNHESNLSLISQRENTNKKHIKSSSKYVGVGFNKNKWRSRIVVNGNRIHLGSFNTEYEAHLAYQKALKELI